jgi:preprotein translocase subunit SecB
MTDLSPSAATSNAATPEPLQIGIAAQYIKDFSFESPSVPQIFGTTPASPPQLQMGVNVQTKALAEGRHEILLTLKLESRIDGKIAFVADLTYGGVFALPKMPDDQLKMFLLIEAPRTLFPFARAILANTIREGGFPNIMINPIDFVALYMANKDQIGTMPTAGAA